jgi:hypothetical protein
MKLTNGSFYKTADGTVVKVQLEQSGKLVAYDAAGNKVQTCGVDEHVNGWEPCGSADYKAARAEAKKPAAKPRKKKDKSTKKE